MFFSERHRKNTSRVCIALVLILGFLWATGGVYSAAISTLALAGTVVIAVEAVNILYLYDKKRYPTLYGSRPEIYVLAITCHRRKANRLRLLKKAGDHYLNLERECRDESRKYDLRGDRGSAAVLSAQADHYRRSADYEYQKLNNFKSQIAAETEKKKFKELMK